MELLGGVVGVAKRDSSHLLTRQSAVYCVKLLARRLAHKHHSHLTQVTPSHPHTPLYTFWTLLVRCISEVQEWYLGCVLFREVSSVQRCPI